MNKNIPTKTKKAEKVLRTMYKTFDLGNLATTVGKNDQVGQCALQIFQAMDGSNLKGFITTSQFEHYLLTIGLGNDAGNKDAIQALILMDVQKNGIISKQDFIVFCRNSYEMHKIYKIVSTFFQFVDTSGDGFISLDEMNNALKYLNEQALDCEELKVISRISRTPNDFEIDDMTTFVCFSTQKNLVEKYRNSTSINSSSS
jgi:Ca2+-binding EF-hand superfamily protein